MISDNSLDPPGHRQRARRGLHRLDRRPQVRLASTASPSPTATSRTEGAMCAQWLQAAGHREGRPVLGAGLVGQGLRRLLPRHARCSSASTITREVKLEPNPVGLQDDLATMRDARHRGHLLRRLRLRHVPLRRRLQGARLGPAPGHGHRVHVLFELQRVGRGPRGLARRRPARRGRHQPQLQRHDRALRGSASAASRATSSSPSPTTPPACAIHGIANAADPRAPKCVKEGMERIRWMPATNGGPGYLHPVRPVRPQGLQGRLPHHPRAARRRAALRRLPPPRVALELAS